MDSASSEISREFPYLFRSYKDGRLERFSGTEIVPPSTNSETGVQSKDVVISPENEVSARLFLPKTAVKGQKLPLLIYIHGGGFCIETPFSPLYTAYLNSVTAETNAVAVSVHYRRSPEHPLPIAFEDSWEAVKWVASHAAAVEPWLKDYADFDRVFLAGDSAGATLSHYVAVRAGVEKLEGVNICGLVAFHPFFHDGKPDELIEFIFPASEGFGDPRLNPAADRNLGKMACKRVLIMVAERDFLRERGWSYYQTLKNGGDWDGEVEIEETPGEEHVFHLRNPSCEKAIQMMKRFVKFINQITMAASDKKPEIAHDYPPFLRIYKDGSVERFVGVEFVPPSTDPITGVQCKDVKISEENNISARIYLPKLTNPSQKLPLLIYFHGGGFCVENPYSPSYHNSLKALVAESNVIAVSVDYRLAPESPLPVAYEDSWFSIKWATSHKNGEGPEEWLNNLTDFGKMFFGGDSAGANIAHHMAIRIGLGEEKLGDEVNLQGIVLIHPYFWGNKPVGKEPVEAEKRAFPAGLWHFACPNTSGCDDPWINPDFDQNVSKLGCKKVLVCVAEMDILRERNWRYKETLVEKGWEGDVEILESKGENHVFHLLNPTCEEAVNMLKKIALFLNN